MALGDKYIDAENRHYNGDWFRPFTAIKMESAILSRQISYLQRIDRTNVVLEISEFNGFDPDDVTKLLQFTDFAGLSVRQPSLVDVAALIWKLGAFRGGRLLDIHLNGTIDISEWPNLCALRVFSPTKCIGVLREQAVEIISDHSSCVQFSVFKKNIQKVARLDLAGYPEKALALGPNDLLRDISLSFFRKLERVDGQLSGLTTVSLKSLPLLKSLDWLGAAAGLQELRIANCPGIAAIDELAPLDGIAFVSVTGRRSSFVTATDWLSLRGVKKLAIDLRRDEKHGAIAMARKKGIRLLW